MKERREAEKTQTDQRQHPGEEESKGRDLIKSNLTDPIRTLMPK